MVFGIVVFLEVKHTSMFKHLHSTVFDYQKDQRRRKLFSFNGVFSFLKNTDIVYIYMLVVEDRERRRRRKGGNSLGAKRMVV